MNADQVHELLFAAVEEQEDEHPYHTTGWGQALWFNHWACKRTFFLP